VFVLAALLVGLVLRRTPFGISVYMTGSNLQATRFSGVDTRRVLIGVYTLSSLLCFVAACLMMAYLNSASAAYAQSYLGEGAALRADAITVHPYLGLAAMGEYVDRAHQSGGCLLVVVRSSNPEGRAVQGADAGHGLTVDQRLLADIAALNARLAPGRIGPVGAVVGPAAVEPRLDLAAANGLLLAPGVGAQGASPADVAATFAACPDRVMPSASRSLLAAGPDPRALRDAAASLNAEFRALL